MSVTASKLPVETATATEPAVGGRIVVSFRNDDPSATCDVEHERRIAERFEHYGFPQTIGVIPWSPGRTHRDPHGDLAVPLEANPEMAAFLREYAARSGSEIALHGYLHRTHPRSRPWRREYFEFRRLGYEEALRRLRAGLAHLESVLGVRPRTFIPPWNRLDRDTLRACAAVGIELVSAAEHTPSVEGLLGYGANCSLAELPARLEALRGAEGRVFLNVLYHSPTTVSPRDLDILERALEAVARCPQCEVITLIGAAIRYRPEIEQVNAAARHVTAQDELHGTPRARVVIYRKAIRALRLPSALERDYERARQLFREGRYTALLALDGPIERGCRRLLRRARALAGLSGAVLGALLAKAAGLGGSGGGGAVSVAALPFGLAAGLLGAGALAAWWATAPDSKREAFVFFASAAVGALVGEAAAAITARIMP
jgi:hypothetical protein